MLVVTKNRVCVCAVEPDRPSLVVPTVNRAAFMPETMLVLAVLPVGKKPCVLAVETQHSLANGNAKAVLRKPFGGTIPAKLI